MARIDSNRVFIVVVLLLLVIGILVVASEFLHRKDAGIAKRKVDLEEARTSISRMGAYGLSRDEFMCRADARLTLHMLETTCGGAGEIVIEHPVAIGVPANVRYVASPGMTYRVDDADRSDFRTKLTASQAASIERLVISAALALEPLEPPGTEYSMPSFSIAMEGCINGQYFAADRGSGESEPAFQTIWLDSHKILNASLERSPAAPPIICM